LTKLLFCYSMYLPMKKARVGVIPQIAKYPTAFGLTFVAIFLLNVAFLGAMDALPDAPVADAEQITHPQSQVSVTTATTPELPVRITAATIGLRASVNNPTSTDIDALDNSLLTGASRYPTSAKLGEEGTVLLFGHSSYLPIVHNQAYKTFDGIQNLKTGDTVSVYSGTQEYRYKVVGVKLADATEDVIELTSTGKHSDPCDL
jgi:sortase (surface protein transpeptidase)